MKTAKELQEAIAAAAHEIGHCCVAMETATVAYEHSLEEHGHLLEELVGIVPADESAKCYRCGSPIVGLQLMCAQCARAEER
jgi:hypothetical protein